jgi:hypothetical protein
MLHDIKERWTKDGIFARDVQMVDPELQIRSVNLFTECEGVSLPMARTPSNSFSVAPVLFLGQEGGPRGCPVVQYMVAWNCCTISQMLLAANVRN